LVLTANWAPTQTTEFFPGLTFANMENSAYTINPTLFGSNFTFWVVMRPTLVTNDQVLFGDGAGHGINISTNILSSDWAGKEKYSDLKMNYLAALEYPYSETYDIVDSGGTLYSNGVVLAKGLGQPTNDFPLNVLGDIQENGYTAGGYIQYIGIWTNYLLTATDATNLDYWYWNYGVTNVTNGLVAWWKLNDGKGTTAADSWGTNTMYFGGSGNVWTNDAIVDGEALYFNGNGWLTNLNPCLASNLPAMTLSCWVKETGLGGNNIGGSLVEKGPGAGYLSGTGWALQGDGTSNVYFGCYDLNDNFLESPHNAADYDWPIIGDESWHFLVGEYTNTPGVGMFPVIYIDGLLIQGPEAGPGPMVTNTLAEGLIFIGPENIPGGNPAGYPAGVMSDVRIYNRQLSLQEINDLYKWRGEP